MRGVVEDIAYISAWIALFASLLAFYRQQCTGVCAEISSSTRELLSRSIERVAESIPDGSRVKLDIPEFELSGSRLEVEIYGREYAIREGESLEVSKAGGVVLVGG